MPELLGNKELHRLLKIPKWIDTRTHNKVCPGVSRIYACKVIEAGSRGRTYVATVMIGNQHVRLVFFKFGPFIQSRVKAGAQVLLEGKIQRPAGSLELEMAQPMVKDPNAEGMNKYHPKYAEKVDTDALVRDGLSITRGEVTFGPDDDHMKQYGLMTGDQLVQKLHLHGYEPQEKLIIEHSVACIEAYRVAHSLFQEAVPDRTEDLLGVDLASTIVKFEEDSGFNLTGDQRQALFEVSKSFNGDSTAGLMVTGDVGVGKSLFASLAIKACVDAGYAAIVMQPNGILTTQFAETCRLVGIEDMQLITGDSKEKPEATCVIGTQALLHRKYIGNKKVGLVVVDEIQKFGTQQFNSLFSKHTAARCISMTATPMPRSIMRSRIGGMKTITMRETPKPRKVHTQITTSGAEVRDFLKARASVRGELIYMVHPSIDSNLMANVDRTMKKLEEWKAQGILPDFVDLYALHGKKENDEKSDIIARFKATSDDRSGVLCSTSLIEIGLDSNKGNTIIILEGAAHGLSGLHQLRGRVGRHGDEGYCLIFTGNENVLPKLKAFASTNDGFAVAEMDLQNRGYGELIGSSQSGKDLMQLNLEDGSHKGYLEDAIQLFAAKEKHDEDDECYSDDRKIINA